MKIIDKDSGRRVGAKDQETKDLNKKLKEEDPILRNADKDENLEEFSAMDPPSAYDKSRALGSDYVSMHPYIKGLMDDHENLKQKLNDFDVAMISFRESHFNFTRELSDEFNKFFVFFDEHIVPHNEREEHYFFRLLHERLIESGEHGTGEIPETAVDLMEDDHNKFIQLASLSFNLLGLGTRLKDAESRAMTFDLAFNSARELIELLRLHIFREDETLFPLAMQLITKDELDQMK